MEKDTMTHWITAAPLSAPQEPAKRLTKAQRRAAARKGSQAAPGGATGPTKREAAIRTHADVKRAAGGEWNEPGPALTPESGLPRLLEMLTYKRPAGSATEDEFISEFIRPLQPWEDAAGNLIVQVGDNPNVMWSCHTDTVHHTGGRQRTFCVGPFVYAADGTDCLGADDGVGVWLCLEMIRAGVAGLYVFHREEECGGNGSSYIARHSPKLLDGIAFCIALDRKGYGDVITHQGGQRCCSDAFAESLAAILGGSFAPDDSGIFTDSANYTDLIGECTNLSVGYFAQHGPTECLNLTFAAELRDKLCKADFAGLVAERQPGEDDYSGWGSAYGSSYYSGGGSYGGSIWGGSSSRSTELYDLEDLTYHHSRKVARWLEQNGVRLEDIAADLGLLDDLARDHR